MSDTDDTFDGYKFDKLGYSQMHEYLMPLLMPGMTALECGIGSGHTASPLGWAGLEIVGVDTDEHWLYACRELYNKHGLGENLKLVYKDIHEFLLICPDKFDVVMMSDVLMFIRKSEGREIVRLGYEALNPGGYMWITTVSTSDEMYYRMIQCQEQIDEQTYMAYSRCHGASPMCFWRPGELDELLSALGARVVYSHEGYNRADGVFVMLLVQKPA
jgi:2-polyprenyl-3-methyl-5-hydroxy-6-metoxy-1,4-benzoquinol methylase